MNGNPVQDLVMQVDRSCTGSLKFPDFLDMMSRILDSRYYTNKVNNTYENQFKTFSKTKRA
jgi:Ca2+-binding EF-hand superfamily protein